MSLFGGWIESALKQPEPEDEKQLAERLNVAVCNCAECGRELVAVKDFQRFRVACLRAFNAKPENLPAVAGRIKERPYCYECLTRRK